MQIQIKDNGKYEELFLQYYDSALKWSLMITRYDHDLADDLVHNVYVQFKQLHQSGKTFNIETFDRYLYISLRNSYISYLRKNIKMREKESTIDNCFVMSVDPREHIKAQDQLFAVCQYACVRKETSISCSVLILRFFHGYFPSEIARIINSSRNVVESRLVCARREAAAYVSNPEDQNFAKYNLPSNKMLNNDANTPPSILNNLQAIIFSSRHGKCFDPEQIAEKYFAKKSRLTRSELSHIISCRKCLDKTNNFLGLPLLEQRDPLYSLQREKNVVPVTKGKEFLSRRAAA